MTHLAAAINAGVLGVKIGQETAKLVETLDGARELKNRARSMELVIANGSKYPLKFCQEYFSSGTWFSQPDLNVAPGDATIATVANRQGSVLTGVTGGMAWEIVGTRKYLILGFTNPCMGSYKTWIDVLDRPDAKYGYDHSKDDSVKMYTKEGFALLAQLKSSNIAHRRFVFGIEDEK